MLDYLRSLPIGVWLGLVIIGLGVWAQDVFGVVLGGILAIVTVITTDRARQQADEDDDASAADDRFKDL